MENEFRKAVTILQASEVGSLGIVHVLDEDDHTYSIHFDHRSFRHWFEAWVDAGSPSPVYYTSGPDGDTLGIDPVG